MNIMIKLSYEKDIIYLLSMITIYVLAWIIVINIVININIKPPTINIIPSQCPLRPIIVSILVREDL